MRDVYSSVREHLQVAASRRKRYYDIRVKSSDFQPGMWVWYYYPRRYARKSSKWQKTYVGPYLIVSVLPPSNAVLQKSKNSQPFVVHFDKLKLFHGTAPPDWRSTPTSTVDVPDQHCELGDTVPAERPSTVKVQPTNNGQLEPVGDEGEDEPVTNDAQLADVPQSTRRSQRRRRRPRHFDGYHLH